MSEASARRGYHHGNLRSAIMTTAIDLVAEKGVSGFTLSEIARLLGVSAGAPYRHFENGEAVLVAVQEQAFTDLADQMESVTLLSARPQEALFDLVRAYLVFAQESPSRYGIMFAGALRARGRQSAALRTSIDRAVATLMRTLEELKLPGLDLKEGADRVWVVAHGVASAAVNGVLADELDSLEASERMARAILLDWLRGVRAAQATEYPGTPALGS